MPGEPHCSQAELAKSLESSLNRKPEAFWRNEGGGGWDQAHRWNLSVRVMGSGPSATSHSLAGEQLGLPGGTGLGRDARKTSSGLIRD